MEAWVGVSYISASAECVHPGPNSPQGQLRRPKGHSLHFSFRGPPILRTPECKHSPGIVDELEQELAFCNSNFRAKARPSSASAQPKLRLTCCNRNCPCHQVLGCARHDNIQTYITSIRRHMYSRPRICLQLHHCVCQNDLSALDRWQVAMVQWKPSSDSASVPEG